MFNPSQPEFWVLAAFIILVLAAFPKVSSFLGKFLDAHATKVRSELEVASKLRAEAEEVLASYKQKQAEFAREAEAILAKAREDSDINNAIAQKELKAALDARLKQALEKIAQEEAAAVAEVRNHVVDITLAAARTIISEQMSNISQSEIIKLALSDIDRKLH